MSPGRIVGAADALPGRWYLGIRNGKTIACMVINPVQSKLILRVEDASADIVSDHEFISLYEPELCEVIPDSKSLRFTVKSEYSAVKTINGAVCVGRNGTFIKVNRIRTESPQYVDIQTGSFGEPIDDYFSFSKWSLVSRCGNEKGDLLNFIGRAQEVDDGAQDRHASSLIPRPRGLPYARTSRGASGRQRRWSAIRPKPMVQP